MKTRAQPAQCVACGWYRWRVWSEVYGFGTCRTCGGQMQRTVARNKLRRALQAEQQLKRS